MRSEPGAAESQRPATYRDVFGVPEFRVLWVAHLQSRFGDQLARVAMAVLVYGATSSALLTALAYALTFLSPLVSAPLLSGIADRYSRRDVMVSTDVGRAAVMALMAVPVIPTPVMIALLVVAVSVQPLYSGARSAILPNVLSGDKYIVAAGFSGITDSMSQLAGFAFGGVLVGFIGPHWALGVNATTFILSATLVRLGVHAHRPTSPDEPGRPTVTRSRFEAIGVVWRDRRLRSLLFLLMLYGFFIVPEGIAAPYADEFGSGSVAVGLLMAADPVGAAIGSIVLTRLIRPDRRERLLAPLAIGSGLPLVASAFATSLPVVIALWMLSGMISSYTMVAHPTFIRLLPDGGRGQVIGVLSSVLQATMGLGILSGGVIADLVPPSLTVAVFGGAGALCAVGAGLAWNRARAEDPAISADGTQAPQQDHRSPSGEEIGNPQEGGVPCETAKCSPRYPVDRPDTHS